MKRWFLSFLQRWFSDPVLDTLEPRLRWRHIIFGVNTEAGARFDKILMVMILLSITALMLETMKVFNHPEIFYGLEWFFTLAFTVEYVARLYVVEGRWKYALSFYGIVDLVSILPTYLSLFIPGANSLLMMRILRLLRVFRVLKMFRFLQEGNMLITALTHSARKIFVFFFSVLILVMIFGSIMYFVEGQQGGFHSIPSSVYWAIVTITTVGYGDIVPQAGLGKMIASFVMITGYSIIAVPTGIYAAELSDTMRQLGAVVCKKCGNQEHVLRAVHCQRCGHELSRDGNPVAKDAAPNPPELKS